MMQPGHNDRYENDTELALCPRCDWVMAFRLPGPRERVCCPRCNHHVAEGPKAHRLTDPIAWALSALVMLLLVFGFDFLSFQTRGIGHAMSFVDAMGAMYHYGYPALALLFILTTAVLPGAFLAGAIYVSTAARSSRPLPLIIPIARWVHHIQMWMMSDVLLVGILVSLIKIVSLAQIGLGPSFIVFCLFSLLLLKTMNALDWPGLWRAIAGPAQTPHRLRSGQTGHEQNAAPCPTCDAILDTRASRHCTRCGRRDWLRQTSRLQLTAALLITAAMLYIPASIYPIMNTQTLLGTEGQTIAGGVMHLIALGSWPIALIIFCASIVVPLTKIVALGWLCICGRYGVHHDNLVQTRLFRFIELIGRWSMIDIFVVSVLAALVQAGAFMSVTPGPAAISFAAVVIITIIAAETFDTRLLWRQTCVER